MAGKTDGRQVRWDSHNAARRRHVLDAAIAVLGESEPGAVVHVQQIAERAGMSRTVVYRHFADRADLDQAVQGRALELLAAELAPAVAFEGTPVAIIRRIVGAYVGWASAHPSVHHFAQQDPPGPAVGRWARGVEQVAGRVETLIDAGVQAWQVQLDEDDVAGLDPLVFGMVGAVSTATGRWLARPERRPDRERFVELLTEALWHQIAGLARARGVELAPDVPVEALLERSHGVAG